MNPSSTDGVCVDDKLKSTMPNQWLCHCMTPPMTDDLRWEWITTRRMDCNDLYLEFDIDIDTDTEYLGDNHSR